MGELQAQRCALSRSQRRQFRGRERGEPFYISWDIETDSPRLLQSVVGQLQLHGTAAVEQERRVERSGIEREVGSDGTAEIAEGQFRANTFCRRSFHGEVLIREGCHWNRRIERKADVGIAVGSDGRRHIAQLKLTAERQGCRGKSHSSKRFG